MLSNVLIMRVKHPVIFKNQHMNMKGIKNPENVKKNFVRYNFEINLYFNIKDSNVSLYT